MTYYSLANKPLRSLLIIPALVALVVLYHQYVVIRVTNSSVQQKTKPSPQEHELPDNQQRSESLIQEHELPDSQQKTEPPIQEPGLYDNQQETKLSRQENELHDKVPPVCSGLIGKVKPCNPDQNSNATNKCPKEANMHYMFSSEHQDYYLYSRHFVHLKRPAVYFDLATNDPLMWSNTYFFDRCLGWSGICVEPNIRYHEPIKENRACSLVPTCISAEEGKQVEFIDFQERSGVNNEDYKFFGLNKSEHETYQLTCTTFNSICTKYNVTSIDYLSLDIEGMELEVLQSIDFKRVHIGIITIEDNSKMKVIEELLVNEGYHRHTVVERGEEVKLIKKHGRLVRFDVIFIHNDVEFGNPK